MESEDVVVRFVVVGELEEVVAVFAQLVLELAIALELLGYYCRDVLFLLAGLLYTYLCLTLLTIWDFIFWSPLNILTRIFMRYYMGSFFISLFMSTY